MTTTSVQFTSPTGISSMSFAEPVPILYGGTGQATQQDGINALSGTQTANTVLRSDGTNVTLSKVVLTTDVSGVLPVANGGTGQTSFAAGYFKSDGTDLSSVSTIPASDVTGNIAGNAENVTGVVAISNGGTGQTTRQLAINALIGTQTNNTVLRSDGTDVTLSKVVLTADVSGVLPVANGGTGVTAATGTGNVVLSAGPTFTGTAEFSNITITGNLTVQGTSTTVSSSSLTISDPLIYIGDGNTGNAVDLGFIGSFNSGTYQHTGLTRDATDGKWKLFSGIVAEPTTTVDFTTWTKDTLVLGQIDTNSTIFNGTTSGAITVQAAATAGTNTITLPATTGTVVTTGDTGTVTNTMLAGSIANSKLVNSSITINGTSFALGDSKTITASASNALTIGTGLTGTSYDGSSIVTVAIDSTVATLTGTQTLTNKTINGSNNTITNVSLTSGVTGTLPVANGGTGQTSFASGYIKSDGTSLSSSSTISGSDISGNIAGNASNVTGTVAIANGGTGNTTASGAINALVPSQTGNAGKYLTTNGTAVSWATVEAAGGSSVTGTNTGIVYNNSSVATGASDILYSSGSLSLGAANTVSNNFGILGASSASSNTYASTVLIKGGSQTLQNSAPAGNVEIYGGSYTGTAGSSTYSGNVIIAGGQGGSSPGNVQIKAYSSTAASYVTAMTVDSSQVQFAVKQSSKDILGSSSVCDEYALYYNASTTAANQVVDSMVASTYSSVIYRIESKTSTNTEITEVTVVVNSSGDVYMNELVLVSSSETYLTVFDADVNSGNLRLLVTPSNSNTQIKIKAVAFRAI
jgi:hypothetical protein